MRAAGLRRRRSEFIARGLRSLERARRTGDCAGADPERRFDFVLTRQLTGAGGDLELATQALPSIRVGVAMLQTSPFTCRNAS